MTKRSQLNPSVARRLGKNSPSRIYSELRVLYSASHNASFSQHTGVEVDRRCRHLAKYIAVLQLVEHKTLH